MYKHMLSIIAVLSSLYTMESISQHHVQTSSSTSSSSSSSSSSSNLSSNPSSNSSSQLSTPSTQLLVLNPNYQPSYLYKDGSNVVPISPLDNFLIPIDLHDKYEIEFYSQLDGEKLNSIGNVYSYHNKLSKLTSEKKYLTTDHLIYSIKFDEITYYYVSLDNSVRSNVCAHSLAHHRLENLMNVVKKIIEENPISVVFFSESCRPSFVGGINERTDERSWLNMRNIIAQITGLEFLIEKTNNDDYAGLSFGISVWVSAGATPFISNYYSKELLSEGFGSVAIGVRSKKNKIVWGVHFPLDFKYTEEENIGENRGVITMRNLQKVMDEYPGSICAFGDMNTIPGIISGGILQAVNDVGKYKLILQDVNTFFGAFYDVVPLQTLRQDFTKKPVQLSDAQNYYKYKILEYVKSQKENEISLHLENFINSKYADKTGGEKFNLDNKVYLMLEENQIEIGQFEIIRQFEEMDLPDLYPEQFEYFGADGNLVNGYWAMQEEYERLRANPNYRIRLHLICANELGKIVDRITLTNI